MITEALRQLGRGRAQLAAAERAYTTAREAGADVGGPLAKMEAARVIYQRVARRAHEAAEARRKGEGHGSM